MAAVLTVANSTAFVLKIKVVGVHFSLSTLIHCISINKQFFLLFKAVMLFCFKVWVTVLLDVCFEKCLLSLLFGQKPVFFCFFLVLYYCFLKNKTHTQNHLSIKRHCQRSTRWWSDIRKWFRVLQAAGGNTNETISLKLDGWVDTGWMHTNSIML